MWCRASVPGVSSPRRTVLDVLREAQRVGTLGDRAVDDVIAHARQFLAALEGRTGRVLDLGTGGGVPGLVIADDRPDLQLTLVDRRATRMDALRLAVAGLGWEARVEVITADAETLSRDLDHQGVYDAVVCRGFGAPEVTARAARPFLKNGGVLVVSEPPGSDGSRWTPDLLGVTGFVGMRTLPGVAILSTE